MSSLPRRFVLLVRGAGPPHAGTPRAGGLYLQALLHTGPHPSTRQNKALFSLSPNMSAADPAPALPPVRLFIGGLPPGAESALTERLAPFGEVTDVTVPAPKGGAAP